MKVRARSWHMQLIRSGEPGYVPRNLCSHFWRVFWCIAGPLAILAMLGWVLVLFTKDVFLPHPTEVLVVIGIVVIGLGLPLLVRALIRRARQRPRREESLLVSYLKAKKRRICPLIEVVDE